ncbi:MAG: hypothetical protein AAF993_19915 [Pseudomonadota bacterium]
MSRHIRAGDVLSRRKGLVMHRGVALGHDRVLHNTPARGEHISSVAEFRAGRRLYVESGHAASRLRAQREQHRQPAGDYHILRNNCEHTVSRVTDGRAHSPQLRGWVMGAGLALATFALTRHPAATAAAYAVGRKLAR